MHANDKEMSLVLLSCFSFLCYPWMFIKLILSSTTSAIIIIYPCSDLNINSIVILPSLILFLHRRLPCENINDTLVYSRVKCCSGIPCTCGFISGTWNTCHPNWRLWVSSLFPDGDTGRCQQTCSHHFMCISFCGGPIKTFTECLAYKSPCPNMRRAHDSMYFFE